MTSQMKGCILIETQQFGVVFDTCSGFRDIIQDDYNDRLIEANNIEAYVSAVVDLMNDDAKRCLMAKTWNGFIKKIFKSKCYKKWIDLFEKLGVSLIDIETN